MSTKCFAHEHNDQISNEAHYRFRSYRRLSGMRSPHSSLRGTHTLGAQATTHPECTGDEYLKRKKINPINNRKVRLDHLTTGNCFCPVVSL